MNTPSFTLDFEKPLRDLEEHLAKVKQSSEAQLLDVSDEVADIEKKIEITKREIYSNLTAWQRVQISRHPQRPYALDYIHGIFQNFEELHGDRVHGDDQALIGGTAFFEKRAVVILGQQKGRSTRENISRNFGMPQPEGYRKAHRLMKLAEKFKMPVISFIDTPGAYPGVGAEERHVAESIARNQLVMSRLRTPIISIVIGEGGSGGALGASVADRVLVLENAYYSVISPEGCAAILWRDRAHAPEAAEALRLSASDLLEFGVADSVIPEPLGGAHHNYEIAEENVRGAIARNLKELRSFSIKALLDRRYSKFRAIGILEDPEIERKTSTFPQPAGERATPSDKTA